LAARAPGPHIFRHVRLAAGRVGLSPVNLGVERDALALDDAPDHDASPLGIGHGRRYGISLAVLTLESPGYVGPPSDFIDPGIFASARRRSADFSNSGPDCFDHFAARTRPHRDDVHGAFV